MGLILRTSHDQMPVGSTISNSRLTIEQMDNNFIYLQNISTNAIEITHSDAIDLINTNSVLRDKTYIITDCDPSLYGTESSFNFGTGTNVIVQGLDTNSFTSLGYGKFYNPKYYDPNTDEGYDVWNSNNNYNLHDIVIYGGRVWRLTSLTENWDNNDYFNLASDWTPLSYENTNYYNVVWDEVEYDIQDDFISSRYDVYNNNFVKNNYRTQYFYCNAYPIQSFRWGHRVDIGGLADCTINNSFFGCLNYYGSTNAYIYGIILENQSAIFDLQLYGNSYLYNLKLNNSYIASLYFEDSEIYNLTLDYSYFGNMEMLGCTINNIRMNSSYFGNMGILGCTLDNFDLSSSEFSNLNLNNSTIEYLEMANNSEMRYSDVYNSYLSKINLKNRGRFRNNDFDTAELSNVSVEGDSYFTYNALYSSDMYNIIVEGDSYFGNITLNSNNANTNSYVSNIQVKNNSYISNDDDNIYLDNGSYFSNITLDNDSYLTGLITLANFSGLSNITITNNSYIDGWTGIILSTYSYISNISLNNEGHLHGYISMNSNNTLDAINVVNDSDFGYGINMNDYSGISHIDVFNSSGFGYGINLGAYTEISNIEITNDSGFAGWWDSIDLNNGSYIQDITISSDSYMGNLVLNNDSYFTDVRVVENSELGALSLDNASSIHNLTLSSESFLGDYINLNYSYISHGVINNQSTCFDIFLNNSHMTNFNIMGNSFISTLNNSYNYLDYSYLDGLLITSNSKLSDFNLSSSSMSCVNIDNTTFNGIGLTGASSIIDLKSNNSIFSNVSISTTSGLYGVNLNNSNLNGTASITLSNNSVVSKVIFNNVYIPNPNLNIGLNLDTNSFFNDSEISNSVFYNLNCYNSYFNHLTINNNSGIYNISLTSSNIGHSDLKISQLMYLNLENSSLYGWFLKQSNFMSYNCSGLGIYNLNMLGSYLDLNGISNSNLRLGNTDMTFNTIKYQFTYYVSGMITGQFNLNVLIPGSGWYIDKVIVDNHADPIVSTGTSFLSLGLLNLNQNYVFNGIDTSELSGNVKVYDISNGSLDGSVTTGVDYLNLNMGGDDIYTGSINFEVIIKNTAFFNSND